MSDNAVYIVVERTRVELVTSSMPFHLNKTRITSGFCELCYTLKIVFVPWLEIYLMGYVL